MNNRFFQKKLNRNSIKEAFDNLPCGICIFDKKGLLALCNRQMYQLVFEKTGKDLQHLLDLEKAFPFQKDLSDLEKTNIFSMPDQKVWAFSKRIIFDDEKNEYTEYIASDITELNLKNEELKIRNERLKEMAKEIKKMSANVVMATCEEETLALKMKVHDQLGRSLIAARQILEQNQPLENVNHMVKEWKNAITLLERAGEEKEEMDMLSEIKKASEGMIEIVTEGNIPEEEEIAYLMVVAIRECLTNALRYADASKLYVHFLSTVNERGVIIRNNGKIPKDSIVEGGGLSSLRKRIEKKFGNMQIESFPEFRLTIKIPVEGGKISGKSFNS